MKHEQRDCSIGSFVPHFKNRLPFLKKQQNADFLKGNMKVTMILKTLVGEYIYIFCFDTKIPGSSRASK